MLLIGIVDSFISFLRVEGFIAPELQLIEPVDLFDEEFGRQDDGDSGEEDTAAPSAGSDNG